tara:strand:- start:29 stop:547 length:519 start_codon:yes stop_codon:yes gene_type:complete
MAKSDNFYLRVEVVCPADQTVVEQELDLGSYVNLGPKSSTLLRINAVDVAFQDADGLVPAVDAGGAAFANWVLATQPSTTMTRISDRSIVSSGSIQMYNATGGAGSPSAISDQSDINPRQMVDGYDVAVDTLYLRGVADNAFNETVYIGLVLECQQITANQSNATALAISQT